MIEILICTCVLFIIYIFSKQVNNDAKFPPGPFSNHIPFIGSLIVLLKNQHANLRQLSKRYGEYVYLRLGERDVVMLSSSTAIKEALENKNVCGRPNLYHLTVIRNGGDSRGIAFNCSLSEWREQRTKTVHNLYSKANDRNVVIEGKVLNFLNQIETFVGTPLNVKPMVTECIFNLMWHLLTGANDYQPIPDNLEKIISSGQKGRCLRFFPRMVPIWKVFSGWIETEQPPQPNFIERSVRLALENYRVKSDFTSLFLKSINQEKEGRQLTIETEEVRSLIVTIMDFLYASLNTVTEVVMWSLAILADSPDVQSEVAREIKTVFGEEKIQSVDRLKMPLLMSFLYEVIRYSAIVPIGPLRECWDDTQLGHYILPKGTLVMFNFLEMCRSPDNWTNPEEFQLKRFIKQGQFCRENKVFFPFSDGFRSCIGKTLALDILFVVIATLLRKYQVRPPPNSAVSLDYVKGTLFTVKEQNLVFTNRL